MAFGGNDKAFNTWFGDLTFQVVPTGYLDPYDGWTDFDTFTISIERGAVDSLLIAHEMAHVFDMRHAGGNPKLYLSQVFVDILNGGCTHLGLRGCLGSKPGNILRIQPWYYFGKGVGEYNPSDRETTTYALRNGSADDFADSFARVIMGDVHREIGDTREFLVRTIVAAAVSSTP